MILYTFGYRGRTHEDFGRVVKDAGLKNPIVVDVRRRTSGARIAKGWDAHSIWLDLMPAFVGWRDDYHPYPNLGNYGKTVGEWTRHEHAWLSLINLTDELVCNDRTPKSSVILLCAEQNPAECHRTQVAEAVKAIIEAAGGKCEIKHLGWEEMAI